MYYAVYSFDSRQLIPSGAGYVCEAYHRTASLKLANTKPSIRPDTTFNRYYAYIATLCNDNKTSTQGIEILKCSVAGLEGQ